jgi:hypothetical protein
MSHNNHNDFSDEKSERNCDFGSIAELQSQIRTNLHHQIHAFYDYQTSEGCHLTEAEILQTVAEFVEDFIAYRKGVSGE